MLTTYIAWWRRRWNGEVATASLPEHGDDRDAESQALRRAFPQELSGLYTEDEMAQADNLSYIDHSEVVDNPENPRKRPQGQRPAKPTEAPTEAVEGSYTEVDPAAHEDHAVLARGQKWIRLRLTKMGAAEPLIKRTLEAVYTLLDRTGGLDDENQWRSVTEDLLAKETTKEVNEYVMEIEALNARR